MANFKVGDKVTMVKAANPKFIGKTGVISEAASDQRLADGTLGTVYSVRLDGRPVKDDGKPADHAADVLGAVLDGDIK